MVTVGGAEVGQMDAVSQLRGALGRRWVDQRLGGNGVVQPQASVVWLVSCSHRPIAEVPFCFRVEVSEAVNEAATQQLRERIPLFRGRASGLLQVLRPCIPDVTIQMCHIQITHITHWFLLGELREKRPAVGLPRINSIPKPLQAVA